MEPLRTVVLVCLALLCSGHPPPTAAAQRDSANDTACLAAADDALWIGTSGAGLFRMTPDGPTRFDRSLGLRGQRVLDCVLAGGSLWIATDGGLDRLDPERARIEPVASGVFTRLAPSTRGLWAYGVDGGVVRIDLPDVADSRARL